MWVYRTDRSWRKGIGHRRRSYSLASRCAGHVHLRVRLFAYDIEQVVQLYVRAVYSVQYRPYDVKIVGFDMLGKQRRRNHQFKVIADVAHFADVLEP